jgi:hypothetical protein
MAMLVIVFDETLEAVVVPGATKIGTSNEDELTPTNV